jgi:hypothetical protein
VDLQLGNFPAIEALAFAVIEMRKREKDFPEFDPKADMTMAQSSSCRTAKDSACKTNHEQIVHSGWILM